MPARYVTSTASANVHIISEGDERRVIGTVKGPKEMALRMAAADGDPLCQVWLAGYQAGTAAGYRGAAKAVGVELPGGKTR